MNLICLSGALFFCFLIVSTYFIRPCSDDLFFYYNFIKKGWFDSILTLNTNIRWTGFLIFNSICATSKNFNSLHVSFFVYFVIIYTILLLTFFFFFKKILVLVFTTIKNTSKLSFALTSLTFISCYFTTINSQEVWFWTIATSIYLLPLIFIIWISILLLNKIENKKNNLILLLFFLVGGTIENMVLCIFIINLIIISSIYKKYNYIHKNLFLGSIAISILPIISLIHSGISKRYHLEEYYKNENGFFNSLFSDFNLTFNFNRLIAILCIYSLFYFLGQHLRTKGEIIKFKSTLFLPKGLIYLFVVLFCTFIPQISLFGNLGPARASFPFTLFINFSVITFCFLLGYKFNIRTKLFLIPLLTVILALTKLNFTQYKAGKTFASFYDDRLKKIKLLNKKSNVIEINEPLPDSGVIPSQELTKIGIKPGITSYYLGRVNGVNKTIYLKK